MRYLERLTVYFLNPVKPVLFGSPLVFSLAESQLASTTLESLYAMATQHLGPLLKLTLPEKDGVLQYPFKFRIVNRYATRARIRVCCKSPTRVICACAHGSCANALNRNTLEMARPAVGARGTSSAWVVI
jgi:hypothetical protein